MPFGNGRGPAGMGPMTGRGAGFCAGYSVPGYMNQMYGRGFGGQGINRGGGRGHRNRFYATGLFGWQRAAYDYPYKRDGAPLGAYGEPYVTQPCYSKEDHLDDLRAHAQHMEGMLKDIKKQIDSLEASAETDTE
ncbi:MAG TPA: hypothetical protein ENN05_02395 [Deltaproteobacteria bacterium]|nr:hypothetical protein [Deltaproteobacteria bacterium]